MVVVALGEPGTAGYLLLRHRRDSGEQSDAEHQQQRKRAILEDSLCFVGLKVGFIY